LTQDGSQAKPKNKKNEEQSHDENAANCKIQSTVLTLWNLPDTLILQRLRAQHIPEIKEISTFRQGLVNHVAQ
jgi:hypothetical protein